VTRRLRARSILPPIVLLALALVATSAATATGSVPGLRDKPASERGAGRAAERAALRSAIRLPDPLDAVAVSSIRIPDPEPSEEPAPPEGEVDAAAPPSLAPAAGASTQRTVVWEGDHETGDLSAWSTGWGGGEFNNGAAASIASQDVARSGSWSAKLTIDTTSGNDTGVRLFRWNESRALTEAYYSAWFYFPERVSTPGGWWNLLQFKSRTATANDATWILNVGNRSDGSMYFYPYYWLSDGPRAGETGKMGFAQPVANIPVGQWVNVEVFLKQSGGHDGQIIVWQDGAEIFRLDNVRTRHPDGNNEWSINNYASQLAPAVATVYVDDARVTTNQPIEGIAQELGATP
jgi:hypothetical protein